MQFPDKAVPSLEGFPDDPGVFDDFRISEELIDILCFAAFASSIEMG
jgi:hypothetical protein